jgi:hypothetical protein
MYVCKIFCFLHPLLLLLSIVNFFCHVLNLFGPVPALAHFVSQKWKTRTRVIMEKMLRTFAFHFIEKIEFRYSRPRRQITS